MSILTMSILAVIALIILGIAIYINITDDDNGWMFVCYIISIISLFLILIVGFGVHASEGYEKMYVEKIKCDTVVKTKNKVYVEFQEKTITYTSKKDYDYINDSTTFCKVSYYNYYGNYVSFNIMLLRDCWKNIEFNKKIDVRK